MINSINYPFFGMVCQISGLDLSGMDQQITSFFIDDCSRPVFAHFAMSADAR